LSLAAGARAAEEHFGLPYTFGTELYLDHVLAKKEILKA
jgi:hypothetical protein